MHLAQFSPQPLLLKLLHHLLVEFLPSFVSQDASLQAVHLEFYILAEKAPFFEDDNCISATMDLSVKVENCCYDTVAAVDLSSHRPTSPQLQLKIH